MSFGDALLLIVCLAVLWLVGGWLWECFKGMLGGIFRRGAEGGDE